MRATPCQAAPSPSPLGPDRPTALPSPMAHAARLEHSFASLNGSRLLPRLSAGGVLLSLRPDGLSVSDRRWTTPSIVHPAAAKPIRSAARRGAMQALSLSII